MGRHFFKADLFEFKEKEENNIYLYIYIYIFFFLKRRKIDIINEIENVTKRTPTLTTRNPGAEEKHFPTTYTLAKTETRRD